MQSRAKRTLAILVGAAALLVGVEATATDGAAIVVGEVLTPPAGSGVDTAGLRNAAEGEIRDMGPGALGKKRHVIISLALTRAATNPVACTVNATVRDAKSGAMIGIIEGAAHSSAPSSAEVLRQVAHAATRSAVRDVPRVLGR